jgi:hypothetical protein
MAIACPRARRVAPDRLAGVVRRVAEGSRVRANPGRVTAGHPRRARRACARRSLEGRTADSRPSRLPDGNLDRASIARVGGAARLAARNEPFFPGLTDVYSEEPAMKTSHTRFLGSIAALVVIVVLALPSCRTQQTPVPAGTNEVELYLYGAERQAESAAQEQEILKALEDLRTLPPEALRAKRYADYSQTPDQWTLAQLLQKYFVPSKPGSIDEAVFYRDAQDPKARAVIEEHIRAIREQRQVKTP